MKRTKVCGTLGVSHPVLQAGLPWVSNPELVAAVSNAGGLGILHPTASIDPDSDIVANLQGNLRRVQRLTQQPFGVALYLPHPQIPEMIEAAVQELQTAIQQVGEHIYSQEAAANVSADGQASTDGVSEDGTDETVEGEFREV